MTQEKENNTPKLDAAKLSAMIEYAVAQNQFSAESAAVPFTKKPFFRWASGVAIAACVTLLFVIGPLQQQTALFVASGHEDWEDIRDFTMYNTLESLY